MSFRVLPALDECCGGCQSCEGNGKVSAKDRNPIHHTFSQQVRVYPSKHVMNVMPTYRKKKLALEQELSRDRAGLTPVSRSSYARKTTNIPSPNPSGSIPHGLARPSSSTVYIATILTLERRAKQAISILYSNNGMISACGWDEIVCRCL